MQQKMGAASCGLGSWNCKKDPKKQGSVNLRRWTFVEFGQIKILGRIWLVKKKQNEKPKAILQHKGSISSIKGYETHHVSSGWYSHRNDSLNNIFSCPYHQKKGHQVILYYLPTKITISLMGAAAYLFSFYKTCWSWQFCEFVTFLGCLLIWSVTLSRVGWLERWRWPPTTGINRSRLKNHPGCWILHHLGWC